MKRIEAIIRRNADKPLRLAFLLISPLIVALSLLIAVFYFWDHQSRHHHLELQLKETAKAHYEQIVLTRLWNAKHGGVYVEVTDETQPNPYLDDPDKTITASNGKTYTKLNPAYMTRQLAELTREEESFKINIAGPNPMNPSNVPDPWELAMIQSFRNGRKEAFGTVQVEGKDYFRYMGPLTIKEECLTCHDSEGYNVGDIKGGISVSVPADFLRSIENELDRRSLIAFGSIGFFTIAILLVTTWHSSKRLGEGLKKEFEAKRFEAAAKVSAAAAHELRQPMTIISGFSELLKEKVAKGEDIREETGIIVGQCDRMNDIIAKMLNVTAYKTKAYDESSEIFDLGVDAQDEEEHT